MYRAKPGNDDDDLDDDDDLVLSGGSTGCSYPTRSSARDGRRRCCRAGDGQRVNRKTGAAADGAGWASLRSERSRGRRSRRRHKVFVLLHGSDDRSAEPRVGADITYIPIGRDFLPHAIIDWASRAVLVERLSTRWMHRSAWGRSKRR